MTTRNTFKAIAITFSVLGATIAPTAFAATSNEVSVEIDTRYLETDWGVEKVYETLTHKAESACVTPSAREISARRIERDCMTDLLDDFIESADIAKLTQHHASVSN